MYFIEQTKTISTRDKNLISSTLPHYQITLKKKIIFYLSLIVSNYKLISLTVERSEVFGKIETFGRCPSTTA